MQYTNVFFALTALAISVSGLVLPVNTVRATQTCEYQEIKRNESAVFGWQLAGIALNADDSDAYCNSVKTDSSQLAQAGFTVDNIEAPVCNASAANTNATSALPQVVDYSSQAFKVMLTNAFHPTNEPAFDYACTSIRFDQLSAFMLDDNQIINATCNQAGPGVTIAPKPFTALAEANKTAVAAYRDTSSQIFAHNYAAIATSTEQLKQYCNRASDYTANLEALELNPSLFASTLCSIQTPPSAAEVQASVMDLTSQQFIIVVENISNVPGWKKWLCSNLDADSMDTVGLNGSKIKTQVCQDAE